MKTWLDEFANYAIDDFRALRARKPHAFMGEDAAMLRLACTDPAFAFHHKCLLAGVRLLGFAGKSTLADGFEAMLLPFAHLEIPSKPLSLSLNSDAVDDLLGATISGQVREFGRKVASRSDRRIVYLDFPKRSFDLGNDCYLRALFVNVNDGASYWAVFEKAGSHCCARMTWLEGGDELVSADGHEDGRVQMASLGIDVTAMLREIEDFAWLALAHHEIECENGVEMERLPHLPGDDTRRSGRKARQVAKKFSLFSVVKVSTRSINRDRSERSPATGDGKTRRGHSVRGHFKMQAYGSKWSRHRLIWIESYDKPGNGDGNSPIPLFQHRAANRLAA
jgi:hypothetical protein